MSLGRPKLNMKAQSSLSARVSCIFDSNDKHQVVSKSYTTNAVEPSDPIDAG